MTSVIGWFGPLIDLSKAALHVGDYVQLLVFVHRTTPLQYKLSKGGEVIRTDIQVGDETRPFFSVSIWQKQMGSMAVAGDVVLLQNVKITKYGDVIQARTHQYSSLKCLLHPYHSILSKGVNELMEDYRGGIATKEKLRKVIEWVKKSNNTHEFHSSQLQQGKLSRNWKLPEERKQPEDCSLVSGLSHLPDSCTAVFYASVAEIFLPLRFRGCGECEPLDGEDMFVGKRLYKNGDGGLATDLICTGCQLCGSPLELDSENMYKQNAVALYCSQSSTRLHVISLIYRPFMLYVWDDSDYAPILVKNKAAELLFGNIKAERVYSSYKGKKNAGEVDSKGVLSPTRQPKEVERGGRGGVLVSCSSKGDKKSLEQKRKQCFLENVDFYRVWLILLKTMLQQGKNSPLKFEVNVNAGLDKENGRFEMVSVQMPCFITK